MESGDDTQEVDLKLSPAIQGCCSQTQVEPSHQREISACLFLVDALNSMRQAKDFCDLVLELNGATFHVHRFVFFIWSPLMKNLLDPASLCIQHARVAYDQSEVFEEFINFLYTGMFTTNTTNISELLLLASTFEVKQLQRLCEEHLIQATTADNVISHFFVAVKFQLPKLESQCMDVLKQNLSDAVHVHEFQDLDPQEIDSFLRSHCVSKLNPEMILFLIISWLGDDVPGRQKYLVPLLKHLDWEVMAKDFLVEISRTHNFFTTNPSSLYLLLQTLHSEKISLGPYTDQFATLQKQYNHLLSSVVTSINSTAPWVSENFQPVEVSLIPKSPKQAIDLRQCSLEKLHSMANDFRSAHMETKVLNDELNVNKSEKFCKKESTSILEYPENENKQQNKMGECGLLSCSIEGSAKKKQQPSLKRNLKRKQHSSPKCNLEQKQQSSLDFNMKQSSLESTLERRQHSSLKSSLEHIPQSSLEHSLGQRPQSSLENSLKQRQQLPLDCSLKLVQKSLQNVDFFSPIDYSQHKISSSQGMKRKLFESIKFRNKKEANISKTEVKNQRAEDGKDSTIKTTPLIPSALGMSQRSLRLHIQEPLQATHSGNESDHDDNHNEGVLHSPSSSSERQGSQSQCTVQAKKKKNDSVNKPSKGLASPDADAEVCERLRLFRCPMCLFHSGQIKEYMEHLKTKHFPGPPFYCDVEACSFSSDKMRVLIAHRRKHGDTRPFVCNLCQVAFSTQNKFYCHQATHSTERKYKCTVCPRAFKLKINLEQHMVIHSDHRPYLCDLCGFSTKFQSHLISHKRIHTGEVFSCTVAPCTYSSPKQSELKAHMQIHTGIKQNICSICGKKFLLLSHLLRHERIHSSVKAHACTNCDYASTRLDKLREHMSRLHGPDSQPAAKRKRWKAIEIPVKQNYRENAEQQNGNVRCKAASHLQNSECETS